MTHPVVAQSLGDAVCALHGDAPAEGTCPRCGRFVCAACAGAEKICPECVTQRVREAPSSRGRAGAARRFLQVAAIAQGLVFVWHAWSIAQPAPVLGQLFAAAVGVIAFWIASLGGAVALGMWLFRALRQLKAAGSTFGRALVASADGDANVVALRVGTWASSLVLGVVTAVGSEVLQASALEKNHSLVAAHAVGILSCGLLILSARVLAGMVRNLQWKFDAWRAGERPAAK